MKKVLLVILLSATWLLKVAPASANNKICEKNFTGGEKCSSNITNAFTGLNSDIELSAVHLFTSIHMVVDKKHSSNVLYLQKPSQVEVNSSSLYVDQLLAIQSAKNFKLLYPFHHFW